MGLPHPAREVNNEGEAAVEAAVVVEAAAAGTEVLLALHSSSSIKKNMTATLKKARIFLMHQISMK